MTNVPVLECGCLVAVFFVNHDAVRIGSPQGLASIYEVAARTRVALERSRNEAALRYLNATLKTRIASALAEQAAGRRRFANRKRWKPWVNSSGASRRTSTIS
jgi:hypothetical protein